LFSGFCLQAQTSHGEAPTICLQAQPYSVKSVVELLLPRKNKIKAFYFYFFREQGLGSRKTSSRPSFEPFCFLNDWYSSDFLKTRSSIDTI